MPPKHKGKQALNDRIDDALEQLHAIQFFTKSRSANQGYTQIQQHYKTLPRQGRKKLYQSLLNDLKLFRDHYGARASNKTYCKLFEEANSEQGYAYLEKRVIDTTLFDRYDRVFPRWPHVKHHAFVIFDGRSESDLYQIFELEGYFFSDAKLFLKLAEDAHKGVQDFRKRKARDQHQLLSLLKAATVSIFSFIEAYLNGLAYDCLYLRHDDLSQSDHDLLREVNSSTKRQQFVPFHQKVFKYPRVVAAADAKNLDLSSFQPAHRLAHDGKELRDALVHPSPFVDLRTLRPTKIALVAGGLKLPYVQELLGAAKDYVKFVEQNLGADPRRSCAYMFEEQVILPSEEQGEVLIHPRTNNESSSFE